MREVEKAANDGNARALIAFKAFCYRVRKRIGAYMAAMGGLDVLIFTAGIGQGSAGVRALALQGLRCMGIHLDEQRNREACGGREIARISTDDSPVTVLVDERPDGVHLSYDRMASLLGPYGSAQALTVARDLDAKIETLLKQSAS